MKSIFLSKTLWLNVVGLLGTIASSGIIPSEYAAILLAALNIINRWFTSQPVGLLGSP